MVNEQLSEQLIKMRKADQAMRERALKDNSLFDASIDKNHTETLKVIVKEHGWPTIPIVGKEASGAAWLLVQHADHDIAFQKTCLALMKNIEKGEIALPNIAYLEDRIRVAEGRPQLYGTQFDASGSNFGARLIWDKDNLDKRRKAMGLSTYGEYRELMEQVYGNED